jgi:GAF domain-containing protein
LSAEAGIVGRLSLPEAGTRFEADDALVVWLLRASKPLALEGLGEAELNARLEARDTRLVRGMEAALLLPLRLRGDLVGIILLSRRRNKELFSRDEIGLLHSLAIQAAADVANARLRARSVRLERENSDLRQELLAALRDRSSVADRA